MDEMEMDGEHTAELAKEGHTAGRIRLAAHEDRMRVAHAMVRVVAAVC
jgi:hypothetical protein